MVGRREVAELAGPACLDVVQPPGVRQHLDRAGDVEQQRGCRCQDHDAAGRLRGAGSGGVVPNHGSEHPTDGGMAATSLFPRILPSRVQRSRRWGMGAATGATCPPILIPARGAGPALRRRVLLTARTTLPAEEPRNQEKITASVPLLSNSPPPRRLGSAAARRCHRSRRFKSFQRVSAHLSAGPRTF